MNVSIRIDYISSSGNHITQRNSLPLRGKKKEEVAYEWWREIKRYMPLECTLEKVLVDGEDITEKVLELEKAPLE